MPGHEKKGAKGAPDPDPSPYLIVSYEDKQKDLAKVSFQYSIDIWIYNFQKHFRLFQKELC